MRYLIIGLLLLCACAKKNPSPAEMQKSVDLDPLRASVFEEGEWPHADWWTLFNDRQLTWMVEQAIANNPDLKRALANVAHALAYARQEKSVLYPNIYQPTSYDWQHYSKEGIFRIPPSTFPAVINQFDLGFELVYELDIWGKYRDKYRAAVDLAKAQLAESAQIHLVISTMTASTYIAYWSNRKQLAVAQALLAKRRLYLELTELRRQHALDNEMEVLAAKEAVILVERRVEDLRTAVELTTYQLKALMGLGPSYALHFEKPAPQFNRPFPLPTNLPLQLLARRPDLMRLIHMADAAALQIKVARKEFYPDVNLAAAIGLTALSFGNWFTSNAYRGYIHPAYRFPFYTAGRLQAQLDEQYAHFDAVVYEYNNQILQAGQEVADGMQNLKNNIEQVLLEQQAIQKLIGIASLSMARMKSGLDNYLTVLSDEISVLDEELKEVQLDEKRLTSVVTLIKALGGGFHGED